MKKILIFCLGLAVIFAAAGFYFDYKDKKENAEARALKEFFQKVEKEEYDQALVLINSNKGLADLAGEEIIALVEFSQAMILYRQAEALYIEYATVLNDPQVTTRPDIAEVLELYKKPIEILDRLQQNENAKNWKWGWRIWNDKVDPLVYQIYIYLYLIGELKEKGNTPENQEKIKEYDKLVREVLYIQALETCQAAVELVKSKDRDGEIIAIQNLEFLTREPTQQAFQREGEGEGKQGKQQEQKGLGHLAKEKGKEGTEGKVKILPLPLQKDKKGKKGAGEAKAKKGKK